MKRVRVTPARAQLTAERKVISAAFDVADRIIDGVKSPHLLRLKFEVMRLREIIEAEERLRNLSHDAMAEINEGRNE